jgi:CubicO group peptidase (beta-lactamase class C family)
MIDAWVEGGDAGAVGAAAVDADGVRHAHYAGDADERTLFALASLTKPLVAMAVLVAAEEGVIDLDAPVGEHIPAYAHGDKRAVTARHLLSHASGLPESGREGVAAVDLPLERPPATRRVYSNEGYVVVGELLSAATGLPHAQYVREAVFEPLGMDAFLPLPEDEAGRAATVREPGLWRSGVALFNSRQWRARGSAAGGAFVSVEGYARFVACLLARGAPLVAEETFDEVATVQFPGLAGGVESFMTWERGDWGLGPDIRDEKNPHWTGRRTSPGTLSHFGASGTLMWADPAAGIGLVALANRGTYSGWMMRAGRWTDLSDGLLDRVLER